MSQLPRVANAILDDRKINQYLLSTVHPIGAAKAKFFMSFGFSPANWAELKSALLNHPMNNPVTSQTRNPFGQKFEVSCSLVAPDGRNPCISRYGSSSRPTPVRGSSPRIQTLERRAYQGSRPLSRPATDQRQSAQHVDGLAELLVSCRANIGGRERGSRLRCRCIARRRTCFPACRRRIGIL